MAIDQNLPMFLENAGANYNAREFRRYFERMMGYDTVAVSGTGAGGIFRSGDLAVTQNGGGSGDQSCNVALGAIYVDGNEQPTQGGYFVYSDATVNVAITAADATFARKDIVGVRVRDSEYSGGTNDALIVVVTGTPSGSPAEPTLPANFCSLALLDIPAGDNTLGSGQITDRRRRMSALGGITVCTSATRPTTTPWQGQVVYETDTYLFSVYTGSAWNSWFGIIRCTSGTRPTTGLASGQRIFETDTGLELTWDGSGWRSTRRIDATTTAAGAWDLLGTLTNPGSGQTQIPGTIDNTKYSSIVIHWALSNATATAADIGLRYNNDSAANYYVDMVYVTDVAGPTRYSANSTYARIGYMPGTSAASGHVVFPAIDAVNANSYQFHHFQEDMYDPGVTRQGEQGSSWRQVGNQALTRLDLFTGAAYSGYVRMYGIRL